MTHPKFLETHEIVFHYKSFLFLSTVSLMIALHVGKQFKGKIRQCITKDILRMHWIETKHKIRIPTTKVEEDDA